MASIEGSAPPLCTFYDLSALGDAIRGPGRFGNAIEVEETASTADKFIALTGRRP